MLEDVEFLIKKNPYMAVSPNLIEYFAIIGYKENFIPKILNTYKTKKNQYKPIVLSGIISKSDYEIINNKLIISQIYPDNPLVILKDKNEQIDESPGKSNVIYSFCFDSTDGKEKIFYVCYAFKFYEKYKNNRKNDNGEEYYIPKAFAIISQYYYFTIFEYICRSLYLLFEDNYNSDMPLELIIYNIVNFIPSPLFHSLQFELFGTAKHDKGKEIRQMSGYPYLEFDLSEIFNLLPLNLVLEIYILTFLESSIIFFCTDLELLNMIMFIMFSLNYPCNDSTYYWHVVSVSKDNFVGDNQFVGKFMASFVGVNCAYDSEFNTAPFGKMHYIVDLDNKKCILLKTEDLDEKGDIIDYQNMNDIQIFINSILKENKFENSYLSKNLITLKQNLEKILTENPEFNPNPKNKYVNFFKFSKNIMNINKIIQEEFYIFNLNILMLFFQDYSLNDSFTAIKKGDLNSSEKKINKLIKNLEKNAELRKEDNVFLQIYRGTTKYGIYFENFIKNFESIDVLAVPLLFSEEFINEKINLIKNKTNDFSFFSIIDSFFFNERPQIHSTLNNINSIYDKKLKKYFNHFKNLKKENRKLISFNKPIINRYIYLLNNHFDKEEILDIFPYLRIQLNNSMTLIERKYIKNTIIEYLENKEGFISTTNYLIFSSIYIFALSISLHSYKRMLVYINDIISSLKYSDILVRHYIFIIIKTFYKYYLVNDSIDSNSVKMYIFMMINFLKEKLIIPNEEMLKLLNSIFNKVKERESKEKTERKSIDLGNENFIKIEKDKNFICFMKYCFIYNRILKPFSMVKVAMKENKICNMIIRTGNKSNLPIIVVKIKDYANSSSFYSPKKIYKFTKEIFNDYLEKNELDLKKLKIGKIRECIINLILYASELNKSKKGLLPFDLLANTLYLLKDFKENENNENAINNDIQNKENKNEVKENNIEVNENKDELNENKDEVTEKID